MRRSVISGLFGLNLVLVRHLGACLGISLLCSATCAAVQAQAGTDAEQSENVGEARAHFGRGVQYYEDGDYGAALLEFKRAYELQAAYQLLYNLGQVSAELKDYANAERYFRGYLKQGGSAIASDRRSEVLAELARLRTRVGSLRIETNQSGAQIRVDDHLIGDATSGPIRVSAGRREVVAEKQGYVPIRRVVDVLGGEEISISLEFTPITVASGNQEASHLVPWITGISSVALLIGAGAIGYSAYSDSSEYKRELNRVTTQDRLDQLSSQTKTKALVADILLGTAVSGGLLTAILVLADGGSSETAGTAAKPRKLTLDATGVRLAF
jgi:tetratricopeptide (TPR) repeat protein